MSFEDPENIDEEEVKEFKEFREKKLKKQKVKEKMNFSMPEGSFKYIFISIVIIVALSFLYYGAIEGWFKTECPEIPACPSIPACPACPEYKATICPSCPNCTLVSGTIGSINQSCIVFDQILNLNISNSTYSIVKRMSFTDSKYSYLPANFTEVINITKIEVKIG